MEGDARAHRLPGRLWLATLLRGGNSAVLRVAFAATKYMPANWGIDNVVVTRT